MDHILVNNHDGSVLNNDLVLEEPRRDFRKNLSASCCHNDLLGQYEGQDWGGVKCMWDLTAESAPVAAVLLSRWPFVHDTVAQPLSETHRERVRESHTESQREPERESEREPERARESQREPERDQPVAREDMAGRHDGCRAHVCAAAAWVIHHLRHNDFSV